MCWFELGNDQCVERGLELLLVVVGISGRRGELEDTHG